MPSTLQVDKIIDSSATTNKELAEYASGNWSWGSGVPAGSVLQVVYNQKTDREAFSTSSGWTDIPGTDQNGSGSIFCASITPSSASNKILIQSHLGGASDAHLFSARLYRGSQTLGISDEIGVRIRTFMQTGSLDGFTNLEFKNLSNVFLDSPNTETEVTYNIKVWDTRDEGIVYINRMKYDANDSDLATSTSTITLMEIAG